MSGSTEYHTAAPPSPRVATFDEGIAAVLPESIAIATQRGGEYGDTWSTDHQVTTFTDHVLTFLPSPACSRTQYREWKRLLQLAALIDVKDQRMLGGFKRDTLVDGINYRAVFCHLSERYHRRWG